jgi:ribosomal-protein-alanine N-acetyltransferase
MDTPINKIKIRLATPDDIKGIMAINLANLSENYDYDTYAKHIEIYRLTYVAVSPSNSDIYEMETMHGYIMGRIEDSVESHITSLAVNESSRRLGLGKRLLLELLLESKKRKLKSCSLQVRESNTSAKLLYEKMGFKSIRILENYYNTENGIFMRRIPL